MVRFTASGAFHILPLAVGNYSLNPHITLVPKGRWEMSSGVIFGLRQCARCTAV